MINKRGRKNRRKAFTAERDEFEQRIVDLRRVIRVMAGGKRMRFRACVVVGDNKGKVGYGVAKGKDVAIAVNKAVNKAKKALITVPIVDNTIPHQVVIKYKAAKVMLRPAPVGTGIVAGGAVRVVLELSGIKNISAKILGTNNKMNNVKAVFMALKDMKPRPGDKLSGVDAKEDKPPKKVLASRKDGSKKLKDKTNKADKSDK